MLAASWSFPDLGICSNIQNCPVSPVVEIVCSGYFHSPFSRFYPPYGVYTRPISAYEVRQCNIITITTVRAITATTTVQDKTQSTILDLIHRLYINCTLFRKSSVHTLSRFSIKSPFVLSLVFLESWRERGSS